MLANQSTMNLDLAGWWVQEGYNNCMSASRSAVIFFFWPASTRWVQHISANWSAVIIFSGQPVLGGYNICWPTGLQ